MQGSGRSHGRPSQGGICQKGLGPLKVIGARGYLFLNLNAKLLVYLFCILLHALEYPENVRIIRVPCTGRVDALHIVTAFKEGADGVIISGCLPEQCNYIDGNLKAVDRVDIMRKTLDVMGIGGDRLETFFTSACMPTWLVLEFKSFTERIRQMNQNKGPPRVEKIPAS